MIVGLALALACAVATSVAFLLKHRGAVLAPDVRVRHPLRSAIDLFRSRWFAIGWGVAIGAWVLHVGALALAPLSIVQAVLSGGLVQRGARADQSLGGGGCDRLGRCVLCLSRPAQIGPGVEVIALTSVAANLTAIVGASPLVFRDPIGSGALEITGRMRHAGRRRRQLRRAPPMPARSRPRQAAPCASR